MSYKFRSEEEELEAFRECFLTNKDAVLMDIKYRISELKKHMDDRKHTIGFFNKYINILELFYKKIDDTKLFDNLEDWWSYDYSVTEYGAILHLTYNTGVTFTNDKVADFACIGEQFNLVEVKTKLLTIEEYAATYNTMPGTVRQWIRRGKIRSAVKAGREWRIPEMAEIPGRGYHWGIYTWTEKLTDMPKKYNFMNEYSQVTIKQDDKDKDKFILIFSGKKNGLKYVNITGKEREKFELMLISNPLIKAEADIEEIFG